MRLRSSDGLSLLVIVDLVFDLLIPNRLGLSDTLPPIVDRLVDEPSLDLRDTFRLSCEGLCILERVNGDLGAVCWDRLDALECWNKRK